MTGVWYRMRHSDKLGEVFIVLLEHTPTGEYWYMVIRDQHHTPAEILERLVDGIIRIWDGNESWVKLYKEGCFEFAVIKIGDTEYHYPYAMLKEVRKQ